MKTRTETTLNASSKVFQRLQMDFQLIVLTVVEICNSVQSSHSKSWSNIITSKRPRMPVGFRYNS